jgi:L-alanine-DL-glutamate epimerase-like enolase superfamily enzyme
LKVSVHIESWQAIRPFRITGNVWERFDSIVVEVSRDGIVGRGEALGVFYMGETAGSIAREVEQLAGRITAGIDRSDLQSLLRPGGARNAIDCALWDLEAKAHKRTIFELTGIVPKTLETVFTIGLESKPEDMAAKAGAASEYKILKVKLDADRPLDRLKAIRMARLDARIVVDANQAWTFEQLVEIAPAFAELGVEMIEQPLPRHADAELEGYRSPVPLGADESCLHLDELDAAAKRYQMINIKLDKTGGLTHALELAGAARARGLRLMAGCMAGSSLAVAPAFVLGCLCDLVDIDGPLLQKWDRLPGLTFEGSRVSVFGPEVWG